MHHLGRQSQEVFAIADFQRLGALHTQIGFVYRAVGPHALAGTLAVQKQQGSAMQLAVQRFEQGILRGFVARATMPRLIG